MLLLLIMEACQEEKNTFKGIPEVEMKQVTVLEGGGALFEAEILTSDNIEFPQHGFLWGINDWPDLNGMHTRVAYLGPAPTEGKFKFTANFGIEEGATNYVFAFLKSDDLLVISAAMSLTGGKSRKPELISISPSEAVCGDTVKITGKYFSFNRSSNLVLFNGTLAESIWSNGEELKVIVPAPDEIPVKVSLVVAGVSSANKLDFKIKPPVLYDFHPNSGTYGDTVTLTGDCFSTSPGCANVFFSDAHAKIIEISRTHYKVVVPTSVSMSPATIEIRYHYSFTYNNRFLINEPVINEVSPSSVYAGDTVLISGGNFNPVPELNKIKIGERDAIVTTASGNQVEIVIPFDLTPGSYSLSMISLQGAPIVWPGTIEIKNPWRKLNDFPGDARTGAIGFAINGKGYIGTGHRGMITLANDFWEYIPLTDSWVRKADSPISVQLASGFSAGGKGYITLGTGTYDSKNKDLFMYDPASDTWTKKAALPSDGSKMRSPTFTIGDKAYVTQYFSLFQYDYSSDTWIQKQTMNLLPGYYFQGGAGFNSGMKGYLGIGYLYESNSNIRDWFEYDPDINAWQQKAEFPGYKVRNTLYFSLPNGKAYVGLGTLNPDYPRAMWEYNPVNDAWKRIGDFPGAGRIDPVVFVIDGKAYLGTGYNGSLLRDFWVFDPEANF